MVRRNCRSSSTACTKQSQANQGGELPKSLSPKDFKGEGDGITKGRIVTSLQFADALVPSGFSEDFCLTHPPWTLSGDKEHLPDSAHSAPE